MTTSPRARESETTRPRCPYCHDLLDEGEAARCSGCSTPQHPECFREHGACVTLGCEHGVLEWKGLEIRVPKAAIRVRARGQRDLASTYWRILFVALPLSFFAIIAALGLDSWLGLRWLSWFVVPVGVAVFVLFCASVVIAGLRGYFAMLNAPPRPETEEERAQRHDWQSAIGIRSEAPRIVSEDAPIEDWTDEVEEGQEPRRERRREAEGAGD